MVKNNETAKIEDWVEYEYKDKKYWYSSKANKSTWIKPIELRDDIDKIIYSKCTWLKELNDDKEVWFNTQTGELSDKVPEDIECMVKNVESFENNDLNDFEIVNKNSAKSAFRSFLEKMMIGHRLKWDVIYPVLYKNKKWKLFDSFLTLGDRRNLFEEHSNKELKKHISKLVLIKGQVRDEITDYMERWDKNLLKDLETLSEYTRFDQFNIKFHWRVLEIEKIYEIFDEYVTKKYEKKLKKCEIHKDISFEASSKIITCVFEAFKNKKLNLDQDPVLLVDIIQRVFPEIADLPEHITLNLIYQAALDYIKLSESVVTRQLIDNEMLLRQYWFNLLTDCKEKNVISPDTQYNEFLFMTLPQDIFDKYNGIAISTSIYEKKKLDSLKKDKLVSLIFVKILTEVSANNMTIKNQTCTLMLYRLILLQGGATSREIYEYFMNHNKFNPLK